MHVSHTHYVLSLCSQQKQSGFKKWCSRIKCLSSSSIRSSRSPCEWFHPGKYCRHTYSCRQVLTRICCIPVLKGAVKLQGLVNCMSHGGEHVKNMSQIFVIERCELLWVSVSFTARRTHPLNIIFKKKMLWLSQWSLLPLRRPANNQFLGILPFGCVQFQDWQVSLIIDYTCHQYTYVN